MGLQEVFQLRSNHLRNALQRLAPNDRIYAVFMTGM